MANINLGHIKGDAGLGLPSGGAAGQFLDKGSNTNYDTEWVNPPTGLYNPFPVEEIYIYMVSNPYTARYTDKNGNVSNLSWTWSGSTCRVNIPEALLDGEIHQLIIYCYTNASNPYFTLVKGTAATGIMTRIWQSGMEVGTTVNLSSTTGISCSNNVKYMTFFQKTS